MIQRYIYIAVVVIVILGAGWYSFSRTNHSIIDVDTLFLKLSLRENESAMSSVTVTNLDLRERLFRLKVHSILIPLEDDSFTLQEKESKKVALVFGTEPYSTGIYAGELQIISEQESKQIPIILEIQSKKVFFDSNINLFPRGDSFSPGEKISLELKIFDLENSGRSHVNLDYFLQAFSSETIFSGSEDVIIGGNLDFSKSFDIPDTVPLGNYVLGVILDYNGSIGTSSSFITIKKKEKNLFGGDMTLSFLIILFFVGISLMLFFYSIFYKNYLLREIRSEYVRELTKERARLYKQERYVYRSLSNPLEKRVYLTELKKIRIKREAHLKELYKDRIDKATRLIKKGDEKQLTRQIALWKKKGYVTSVLEEKFKAPSARGIKQKIAEWKKKGYNTELFDE